MRPSYACSFALKNKGAGDPHERAQGKPGARCTRSPCAKVESTRVVTTGSPGHPAFPCAMVLTASSALSLVTGLCCHHRRRNCFHQLDASVGASGPHGFAVRAQRHSSFDVACVHRIPHPTFVTIAKRPSCEGGTGKDVEVIWVKSEPESFCEEGWTGRSVICPSGTISKPGCRFLSPDHTPARFRCRPGRRNNRWGRGDPVFRIASETPEMPEIKRICHDRSYRHGPRRPARARPAARSSERHRTVDGFPGSHPLRHRRLVDDPKLWFQRRHRILCVHL